MKNSKIGWTDHTFNPWMGCVHVSPACDHCYAETLSKRTGHADRWGLDGERTVTSAGYWRNPAKWNRAAEERGRPALVFSASLADVFEDRPDLEEPRARLFEVIASTPWLVWMLLTKRPENILEMTPAGWHGAGFAEHPERLWPSNVWVGTTVEDQLRADERIPHLLDVPAPVRFLSCEPLLGHVDLVPWIDRIHVADCPVRYPTEIGWIIAGGESGPGFRPLELDHVRELERVAELTETPFFYKQDGGLYGGGHLLDGELRYAWPAGAGDRSDVIAAARAEALGETSVEVHRG